MAGIYTFLWANGYRPFMTSESEKIDPTTEGNFAWDIEIYNTHAPRGPQGTHMVLPHPSGDPRGLRRVWAV